jgi:uncharacterized membrane protein YgdD (TMEM256/DUF423 family)
MRPVLLAAAVGGFLTVGIGAFAAHGLRGAVDARALAWIETGVRYQAWHSLALLGVAALMAVRPGRLLSLSAAAFVLGIVLFSGSLYGLALTGSRGFALVTPFGGTLFLVGWALLAIHAWRQPQP